MCCYLLYLGKISIFLKRVSFLYISKDNKQLFLSLHFLPLYLESCNHKANTSKEWDLFPSSLSALFSVESSSWFASVQGAVYYSLYALQHSGQQLDRLFYTVTIMESYMAF